MFRLENIIFNVNENKKKKKYAVYVLRGRQKKNEREFAS